jgi:hypothetical protein
MAWKMKRVVGFDLMRTEVVPAGINGALDIPE